MHFSIVRFELVQAVAPLSDTVGRHDVLLTPCSKETFKIIYKDEHPHRGCFGNLAEALALFGIEPDHIPVAFNCFMNVVIQPETGALNVQAPLEPLGALLDRHELTGCLTSL